MKLWTIKQVESIFTKEKWMEWFKEFYNFLTNRKQMAKDELGNEIPNDAKDAQQESGQQQDQSQQENLTDSSTATSSVADLTSPKIEETGMITVQVPSESALERLKDWGEVEWTHFENFIKGTENKVATAVDSTVAPLDSVLSQLQAHKSDLITKIESVLPNFISTVKLAIVNEAEAIEEKIKTEVDNIANIKTSFKSVLGTLENLI